MGGMLAIHSPEKTCLLKSEFLAAWNFKHCKGATYILRFSPPPAKPLDTKEQEEALELLENIRALLGEWPLCLLEGVIYGPGT